MKTLSKKVESEKAEGVKIPEEFQSSVHSFLSSCNDRVCLDYLVQRVHDKRAEMANEDAEETMDTEGMPEE